MIDLVRKIQGEKLVIPKHRKYRTSRPLFSRSTIGIFRCVIDNPDITVTELVVKTGVSESHGRYSLVSFFEKELMTRIDHKVVGGITHTYKISGSKISARELADSEEIKLNTPNLTGRMEQVVRLITDSGPRTAHQIATDLGVNNQNARNYIKRLLRINMISKVASDIKGIQFEYAEVAA